jgi:hypothetical protein
MGAALFRVLRGILQERRETRAIDVATSDDRRHAMPSNVDAIAAAATAPAPSTTMCS